MSANYTIRMVSGKWKPSIICSLGLGEKRFGQLQRYFNTLYGVKVSEKVLTEQLNQLMKDHIVKRTSYPTVPPKVIYSLTDHGVQLKQLLIRLAEFSEELVQSGEITDVQYKYGSKEMKGLAPLPDYASKKRKRTEKTIE